MSKAYRQYIGKIIIQSKKKIALLTKATRGHKSSHVIYTTPVNGTQFLGYHKLSILDLANVTLGLSDYDCIEPDFTWIDNTLTDIFQDKNESNKNYIIIAPESVALESPRGNIWHKVVEVAHSHNCIVLENSALKNVLQYGDVAINQSIEEAYIAAKKAVAVVSSRSGLADLLAFSKCKLIVLYPLNPIFREKFTFSNMPFSEHVVEFYENESDEIIKCIDRIISTTI